MKLKRIIILGLVLACAGISHAADILTVKNVELAPGESVTLDIELSNSSTNLMGWQCDISLPEGLTLELKADGKPKATLGERFSTTNHSISSSCRANNTYRFIATTFEGDAIPGTSGTLFSVTVKADASLAVSTKLTGTVENIEFNTINNKKLSLDNVSFDITIASSVTKGDVNGDEVVNIADAVCILNYLVGMNPSPFIEAAADVNGDTVIDIADAVHIVNYVVGKIDALAPKVDGNMQELE